MALTEPIECVGVILRSVALDLSKAGATGRAGGPVQDLLGNTVGTVAFTTSLLRRPGLELAGRIDAEKTRIAKELRHAAEEVAEMAAGGAITPREAAEAGDLLKRLERQALPPKARRLRPGKSGRPPKLDERHFAKVAAIYQANDLGVRSAPTKAVAEAFGARRSTANKWVARARDMHLLPPATSGRGHEK